jgi:hypothetical protein
MPDIRYAAPVDDNFVRPALSTDCSTASGSNASDSVVYNATTGQAHCFGFINWSHSGGTPTTGNIKMVGSDGNTYLDQDVTAAGAGFTPFFGSLPVNVGCTVTGAAPGSGVTVKLGRIQHWLQ